VGEWRYNSTQFQTRQQMLVGSFTPPTALLPGVDPHYRLNKKLGGAPWSVSGRFGKEIDYCPCRDSNHDIWNSTEYAIFTPYRTEIAASQNTETNRIILFTGIFAVVLTHTQTHTSDFKLVCFIQNKLIILIIQ
jgi:hypothetical protein